MTSGLVSAATRFATTLQSIDLEYGYTFTDDGLTCFAQCHQLRSFVLKDCPQITGTVVFRSTKVVSLILLLTFFFP